MKPKPLAILIIIMLAAGVCLMYFKYNPHIYYIGENDTFNVDVGDTITIRLNENGSTNSRNVWLNEKSGHVKRVSSQYIPDPNFFKSDGKGGHVRMKFVAIKNGLDTIKTANMPFEQHYSPKTEPHNEFFISIKK